MTSVNATRKVVFRYRPERPVSFADVRGDMHHWLHPERMRQTGDGSLEASFELPVGTYDYKFHLDRDEWLVDPVNPRTRTRNGTRNSLLVVGGTDEPVLHAPARPYLFLDDDERLCVRAGLRRGLGDRLGLRWDEGGGERVTWMRLVAREGEHDLYETFLPGSSKSVEYGFLLEDGRCVGAPGGAGQLFRVSLGPLGPKAPDWWRDAVLYTIFVDRFRRAGTGGEWADPEYTAGDFRAGGNLDGIVEAIPHLLGLGVTALHLTPICAAPSVHRYDFVDPRAVDADIGGEDAFDRLLATAHEADLRVILDVTVTHAHRDFFAFRDVREHGPRSRYWDWFEIHSYPFAEGPNPGYAHYQKGQWQEPLLRTDNPEVCDFLLTTFRQWTRRGVDGFRIDAASDVPLGLVRRIGRAVQALNRDAVIFGELIPSNTERWTADAVDSATDFGTQEAMYDWLVRGKADGSQVAAQCEQRRFSRGGPGWTSIGFTSTHDQPRLRTLTGDTRPARIGQLFVLMRASVPMLYYGDEVGLAAEEKREFEDSWPDRQCMPWDESSWDGETLALVREAIRVRKDHVALRRGDEHFLDLGPDAPMAVGIRRTAGGEVVDVLLNGSAEPCTVPLHGDEPAKILLAHGEVAVDDAVELGPWSAVVLDRTRAVEPELLEKNRILAGMAYAKGMAVCPAYPSNLYVTVTEACNLGCRHCITGAPSLTREGRAREIRPWLVDALMDVFAAADYFGFTHGGESLVSPMLPVVLRAIREARGDRPYHVHLLTNGKALDRETTRRLIGLGLTSLMVSLDGATAEINDGFRSEGSFWPAVEHIRDAIRVRERLGADLRVGISMVVGRSNVEELSYMGDLALSLGVDWLKIEEMVPATSFARQEMIAPAHPRVLEAMADLSAKLEKSGVVLVDHLNPDPEAASFRKADNFANRACFHPRMSAWEQACVDPDGTVRLIDYHHPPIGNLSESSFFDLWNSEVAQRVRRRALPQD